MPPKYPRILKCMCGHPMTHGTIHTKTTASSHFFYKMAAIIAVRIGLAKGIYIEENLTELTAQIEALGLPETKDDFLKAYQELPNESRENYEERIIEQREIEVMEAARLLDPAEIMPLPCRGPETLPRMRGLPA